MTNSLQQLTSDYCIFSDMDGTFLDTDKHLIQRNMKLLDTLAEKNIAFVPCTGRALLALPEEIRQHQAVEYAICADGASIYRVADNQTIYSTPLDKQATLDLYERISSYPIIFEVFADGQVKTNRDHWLRLQQSGLSAAHIAYLQASRKPTDMPTEEILATSQVIERVGVHWMPEDEALLAPLVEDALDASMHATSSMAHSFEILNAATSKGTALRWLTAYLHKEVAHTLAFGDSANDVAMLKAAGLGVVVANGLPAAREVADAVCPSNDEAGVAQFIEPLL